MSLLRFKLNHRDAKDLLAKEAEQDHWPAFRNLVLALKDVIGDGPPAGGKEPRRWSLRDRPPQARRPTETSQTRELVWQRAEGQCECGCLRRIRWNTLEMDHFLGRGKWPESPETCWALSRECHTAKHAGKPSRLRWLRLFLDHLEHHGFGESATAQKVRGEVEGQELVQKAHALRARAVGVELADRMEALYGAGARRWCPPCQQRLASGPRVEHPYSATCGAWLTDPAAPVCGTWTAVPGAAALRCDGCGAQWFGAPAGGKHFRDAYLCGAPWPASITAGGSTNG